MLKAIMTYALQSSDKEEVEEILQRLSTMQSIKNKAYNKVLNETTTAIKKHKESL